LKTGDDKDSSKDVVETKPEFVIPGSPLQEAHEKLMEENSGEFYRVLEPLLKSIYLLNLKFLRKSLLKKE